MADNTFLKDVLTSLRSKPKKLSSKYFYDKKGDQLFQTIMGLQEYYLTRCEFEILSMHREAMVNTFMESEKPFEIIELGAGDGLKTRLLLETAVKMNAEFQYTPVDISANALDLLRERLASELPGLKFTGVQGDYFEVLHELHESHQNTRKVILFLGSNIGNFNETDTNVFLSNLSKNLDKDDLALIGFDLKKDPRIILDAYNDSSGVTRAFNLNLLNRINRELDANFDLDKFDHYPTYDPESGEAKSYLVSRAEQVVTISGQEIAFQHSEPIHTEISRKFSLQTIEDLAQKNGFTLENNFFDCKHYFTDSLWRVV